MLAGTLDTFPVEDIFRLIEATRQTGLLTVDGPAKASFVFDSGRLHFADRPDGLGLAQRLSAAGAIDEGAWAKATGGAVTVWDALVAEGAALDVLAGMLREELEDVAESLVGATSGTFEFEQSTTGTFGSLGYSVDEVLGGAADRRERWEAVDRKVRSGAVVPSLAPQLPTDSQDVTLGRSDWSVVARCDGKRSVVEIAASLGRTHLAAAEAVGRLVASGVAAVIGIATDDDVDDEEEAQAMPTVEVVLDPEETDIDVGPGVPVPVATLGGGPAETVIKVDRELVGAGAGSGADRHQAISMLSALSRG